MSSLLLDYIWGRSQIPFLVLKHITTTTQKKNQTQPKAHTFCLKHAYSWRFASSEIALLKSISYTQLAASERPGHRFLPSA